MFYSSEAPTGYVNVSVKKCLELCEKYLTKREARITRQREDLITYTMGKSLTSKWQKLFGKPDVYPTREEAIEILENECTDMFDYSAWQAVERRGSLLAETVKQTKASAENSSGSIFLTTEFYSFLLDSE